MKKNTLVLILILFLFSCMSNNVYALTPTYEFSDSYKNSQFYTNLMNVTLTGNQRTDIVNVALSQYGYTEGNYSGDYSGSSNGSNNYTEYQRMPGVTSGQGNASAGWCAAFVSWCARQAGIPTSILGNSTTSSISNFGLTKTSTPKQGSLAFVQFDSDVNIDHTALVYDVDDTYVYTIEGNRNNKVDKKKYYKSTGKQVNYSSTYIEFYGNPSYIENIDIKAPTNVKVNTYGTDVTVSWSASANATSYDVYLIQSPWGWGDIKYSKSVTGTSYKFTGVKIGSYKAFVIARPNDDTVQSSWVSFTVTPLPSAPTNVKVSVYGTDVTVTWNSSSYASSYDVYLIQSPNRWEDVKYSQSVTGTSCTFSNVSEGCYNAFVVSRPNSSDVQSDWVGFNIVLPLAPTNVCAYTVGSKVDVSWNASANAINYDVYLIQSPNTWNDVKYSQNVAGTHCSFTNVESGYYSVFVVARPNSSAVQSDWVGITVKAKLPDAPIIKHNLDHGYTSSGASVTVSWEEIDNAESYSYYLTEYPEGYAYTTNTKSGVVTENQVVFSDLKNGLYTMFVHAKNNVGMSPQSNWISFYIYENEYLPSKTIEYNGHIYAIYDYEMSWTFARDLCKHLGGHLVTITDKSESEVVTELINYGSKNAYWLGASCVNVETGEYNWVTGEIFDFTNWYEGEPNFSGDRGDLELYAEIRKSYNNQWNDVKNTSKTDKGFIIEIEPDDKYITHTETFCGNKYLLIDKNTTWLDAKLYCEMLGGHLVTVDDVEEQNFLNSFILKGDRSWYCIGATKESGEWKWLNGNVADNIEWSSNAKGWTGDYLMQYGDGFADGCFPVSNSYYPASHIYRIGFVCEIPFADIETNVIKSDITYTITAKTYNISDPCQIIAAGYKNGQLISVDKVSPADNSGELVLKGDIDEIKVMVWDSLTGLKPLCEPEIIPSSEFMTE